MIDNLGDIASDSGMINLILRQGEFNVLHVNAQSLVPRVNSTKFDEVRHMMENCSVDAFGISETWYNDSVSNNAVRISGFKVYRNDRTRSRGGGVCLYIRESLKARVIYDDNDDNVEALFVEVLISNNISVLLGVLYLPNGNFLCCDNLIMDYSSRYDNVIIMGDFNTNMFTHGNLVREICRPSSLSVVHNSRPTHFSPRDGTTSLIDYFLVSNIDLVTGSNQFQVPALNSYHALIQISYNLSSSSSSCEFFYRDYKHFNLEQCFSQLQSVDFSPFYNNTSIDENAIFFNSVVTDIFDNNVPLRRFVKRNDNEWMNDPRVCRAKRNRNMAYRNYRGNRTDDNFNIYCLHRNQLKSIIRKIRKETCLRFFSNCNQKQMWSKLRTVGALDDSSRPFSMDLDEFNEFSRMPRLQSENTSFNPMSLPYVDGFSFSNVTEMEVFGAMSQIKSDAIGSDGIHLKFLKFIFPAISAEFTFLLNSIITTSIVPKIWKIGKIVPVPKIRSPKVITDFRPISILPVFSKILEVLLRQQMLTYLNTTGFISDFQSGFRKGHNTTGALLDITETIRVNLDKGNTSALIFLDFRKAFDSISHTILVEKLLNHFGFSSCGCKLIWSLLSDRNQFVQVGDQCSQLLEINRGIPQGTILGPLMFLLYINDIFRILSFLSCYTYADDIQLLATSELPNLQNFEDLINRDLRHIVEWSNTNFLELNPLKCKVMLFSKYSNINLNILLDNERLEVVSQYKTLGLILDDKLSFDQHVSLVISRVSWTLRRIYNVAYYLPLAVRRRVAIALCLPLFLYCIEIYSCTSASNIERLKKCFNRVVRYIYNLHIGESVSEHRNSILGCEFSQYIDLRQLVFFFKTVKYGNPPYLLRKFNFGSSSRTHTLICPRHTSLCMSRSFCVKISRLWNSIIPYHERSFSQTLSSFKNICILNL